ncbi:ATP-binding cassette domain-containing protein [Streptomyces sp. DSM 44917]|uniref:ATP-binding cassette domain-containing protein n=1 Tax=Streptomyces boetiae TaxID=3075541 RepID=A0ABU2L7J9_9ACTN|nr:ATP-binding cassette domain-containing protein [Streptomyces sp. DSM 44917]MDT0307312.1 ATP-binding cassette domain-containing protein [Streptomyces sp. DSM 44917]
MSCDLPDHRGVTTYLVSSLEPALRVMVQSVGGMGLELVTLLRRLVGHGRPPTPEPGGGHTVHCYDLALRDVTFRYGPHSEPVLDSANVRIDHGEHLALVGTSGIGKSTLADVLSGREAPDRGTVLLSGAALSTLRADWLRRTVVLARWPRRRSVVAIPVTNPVCFP